MKKEKKKNRKLLFQVGIIAGIVFIITIFINSIVIYSSNTKIYLKSREKDIIRDITPIKGVMESVPSLEWMIPYWKRDMYSLYEESEKYKAEVDAYFAENDYYGYESLSVDFMESLPENIKTGVTSQLYFRLYEMLMDIYVRALYYPMVVVDVTGDNDTILIPTIYDAEREKYSVIPEWIITNFQMGSNQDPIFVVESTVDSTVQSKENPQTGESGGLIGDSTASNESDEYESDEYKLYEDDVIYYKGYFPIYCEGKLVMVIHLAYEWQELKSGIGKSVGKSMIISLVLLLVAAIVILLVIYRKSIRPLTQIQAGVRNYMEDKNVENIVREMSWVKARNEVGILADDIAIMSVEIEKYNKDITTLATDKARVDSELDMARQIQLNMLPNIFPAFPDHKEFDIYASMNPAKEVGGDFYDFFMVDNDHLGLVIADVSGKGVPAALFMMMSKILIQNFALDGLSPEAVLMKTNEVICRNNPNDMFVTVWIGIVELSTGRLTACNAGHEYPVVRQPDGKFEFFKDPHGFVVGGMEGLSYQMYEIMLQPGATLFVYTDGVPEATNSRGEMYGPDKLLETLNQDPELDPQKILETVKQSVDKFVGDAPQFDDLTMLSIKLKK